MKVMYLADNIGKDGTIYPTVGEHIRNANSGNMTAENISSAIKDNTDRAKVNMKLDVTAENLKIALVAILTGKTGYFGGLDTDALTPEQLTEIKTYLSVI